MLGKSERDIEHIRTDREKIGSGTGCHIDVGQVESSRTEWMGDGASLKQGQANRNEFGPVEMVWDM